MAKRGRPTKATEDKRTHIVTCALTADEHERLCVLAFHTDATLSDVIRTLLAVATTDENLSRLAG